MKTIYFIAALVFFATNANAQHKVKVKRLDPFEKEPEKSIFFTSYDASRRGSLIIYDDNAKGDNSVKILSEPPPDAIVAFATAITNSVSVSDKLNAAQSVELTQSINELTSRNTTIVVLRDALYRLNEYDFNHKMDEERYDSAFLKIINLVEKIAKLELEKEATKQATKQVEKKQAEVDLLALEKSFIDNEKLGAMKNYQIAINLLLKKKLNDAKLYFKAMYKKYPTHFNIDEINQKLEDYSADKITDAQWNEIYKFLKANSWGIDQDVLEEIQNRLDKEK